MTRIFFRADTGTENRFRHNLIVAEWFYMVFSMSKTQLRCPRALPRLLCGPRALRRWTRSSGALSSSPGGCFYSKQVFLLRTPTDPHADQPEIASSQRLSTGSPVSTVRHGTLCDVLWHLDLPRYHTDDVEPSSGSPEQLGVDFRCPEKIFLPGKNSSHRGRISPYSSST